MRWVFALSLVLGMIALIGWVLFSGTRQGGPDRRWGVKGRQWVAATIAFGMGGLSAAYAGWKIGWATLAAVVAAAAAAWYAGAIGNSGGEGQS